RETKEPYSWEEKIGMRVCREARQRGLITRPLNNILVIMPPLCINISQLNKMMDILYESLEVATEAS
ncbi:MAG: adenosylmethionine--8-amino-7-oxononanoate transaminase, partial [Patescibacteria group bacterium]|nr:adenosylmethionine--8-amino-7-oxononanoate transaminase [Patescibacteria group bacterium]